MGRILVTGATGQFGKATIDFLLKKDIVADNIVALVRDELKSEELKAKGIQIKIGNYDRYTSLANALEGVETLLLVSSSDVMKRITQHENVIKAAINAGVNYIVYTSFERKNETESSPLAFSNNSHIETELAIKSSGIAILRNNLYMDYLLLFIGKQVKQTGIFFPAGNAKGSFATRSDMAEATANILTEKGHENKEYVIANTENITFENVAQLLGAITGNEITYTSPDPSTYISTLTQAGISTEFAGAFAALAEAIKQGELEVSKTDLENLLGRKPTSAKEYLETAFSK